MPDIVERLKSPGVFLDQGGMVSLVAYEAADEITRLRGIVEALSAERDRLWTDKLKTQGEIIRLREEESSKLKVRTSILNALREENARLRVFGGREMSDIVVRLRDAARFLDELEDFPELQTEAADEILRLRKALARLRQAVKHAYNEGWLDWDEEQ